MPLMVRTWDVECADGKTISRELRIDEEQYSFSDNLVTVHDSGVLRVWPEDHAEDAPHDVLVFSPVGWLKVTERTIRLKDK